MTSRTQSLDIRLLYLILYYNIYYYQNNQKEKTKTKQLQLYDLYIHNTNTALDIAYNF